MALLGDCRVTKILAAYEVKMNMAARHEMNTRSRTVWERGSLYKPETKVT